MTTTACTGTTTDYHRFYKKRLTRTISSTNCLDPGRPPGAVATSHRHNADYSDGAAHGTNDSDHTDKVDNPNSAHADKAYDPIGSADGFGLNLGLPLCGSSVHDPDFWSGTPWEDDWDDAPDYDIWDDHPGHDAPECTPGTAPNSDKPDNSDEAAKANYSDGAAHGTNDSDHTDKFDNPNSAHADKAYDPAGTADGVINSDNSTPSDGIVCDAQLGMPWLGAHDLPRRLRTDAHLAQLRVENARPGRCKMRAKMSATAVAEYHVAVAAYNARHADTRAACDRLLRMLKAIQFSQVTRDVAKQFLAGVDAELASIMKQTASRRLSVAQAAVPHASLEGTAALSVAHNSDKATRTKSRRRKQKMRSHHPPPVPDAAPSPRGHDPGSGSIPPSEVSPQPPEPPAQRRHRSRKHRNRRPHHRGRPPEVAAAPVSPPHTSTSSLTAETSGEWAAVGSAERENVDARRILATIQSNFCHDNRGTAHDPPTIHCNPLPSLPVTRPAIPPLPGGLVP